MIKKFIKDKKKANSAQKNNSVKGELANLNDQKSKSNIVNPLEPIVEHR